jgi:quercetin dioxygenase-like cupin family protein
MNVHRRAAHDQTSGSPPEMQSDPADADGRLSFLDRALSHSFELRVVALAPGQSRPYHPADWRDSIVVVEGGEIELEALCGLRLRFSPGAVIYLVGLPLRGFRCSGSKPALLVAVSRRSPDPGHPVASVTGSSVPQPEVTA